LVFTSVSEVISLRSSKIKSRRELAKIDERGRRKYEYPEGWGTMALVRTCHSALQKLLKAIIKFKDATNCFNL
jgi:hypothetical protein